MKMTPPGSKKVSEGRPRGRPATLRQAFLWPDGWFQTDSVDVQGHSEALRSLQVLQEVLRGAPRHHFDVNLLKIKCDFRIDFNTSFRYFSWSSFGTNHTRHITHHTKYHDKAHDKHAHKHTHLTRYETLGGASIVDSPLSGG